MNKSFTYPSVDDPDLLYKLYKKAEFYFNKTTANYDVDTYEKLEKYRKIKCNVKPLKLKEYQYLSSNYINPDTPYKGMLIFHEIGTGKTCVGVSIAEKFKPLVEKYNTKIFVLVPGPMLKEQWKKQIISCTNNTYVNSTDDNINNALGLINNYYRIMSFKSFQKKVLGEKIADTQTNTTKIKKQYKKNSSGDYLRNISSDRIEYLSNTVLIIDEAHNLSNTSNSYREAVEKIIRHKNSTNLKIVLMSGTPMKNNADDIINLINLLRPINSQIERDKIFTSDKNYKMNIKENGLEYLKKMIKGYVSYFRGGDLYLYAKRVDIGIIPDGLLFTKVIKSFLEPFQEKLYIETEIEMEEGLDKKAEAVSNFVFPIINKNNELVGTYGKEGLFNLINQIKTNNNKINKLIADKFFDGKIDDYVVVKNNDVGINGAIFKLENLHHFSKKYYNCLNNINELFANKTEGPKTAFIYSNLVTIGILLFKEVLIANGYLEFIEEQKYTINDNTICYYCGTQYIDHNDSDHTFFPATFIVITGSLNEDENDEVQDLKKTLLDTIFNNINNKNGKDIKLVLGTPTMNEGISLKNVGQVHILDVYYNYTRIDQAIGRGIRQCSHYDLMNENNIYPEIKVFKYVISLKDKLSTDELLYKKAELKHILVKKIERALKEVAIDCPLNYENNVRKTDIEKYKNCIHGETCPAECDYMNCFYKCDDNKLNDEYFDGMKYKPVENIDMSTYSYELNKIEIDFCKENIKEMYLTNYIYTLKNITKFIKNKYEQNSDIKKYNDFYVYKALEYFLLVSNNDFNNYNDIMYDKYERKGYLIFRYKYYLFQPLEYSENISNYYRENYTYNMSSKLSLYNFLKKENEKVINIKYDFISGMEYYDSLNRTEFKYVGIIDKLDNNTDIFKIRNKKIYSSKKRETGKQSLLGSVCYFSNNRDYIMGIAKDLGIHVKNKKKNICDAIQDKLYNLEKYQTGEKKLTYMIIPYNHPTIPFPLNLEDRVNMFVDKLKYKYPDVKIKIEINNEKNIKYIIRYSVYDKKYKTDME